MGRTAVAACPQLALRRVSKGLDSEPKSTSSEEVEKVSPELVVHDPDGTVQSVRYSMLTSMLLNELQKEHQLNGWSAS